MRDPENQVPGNFSEIVVMLPCIVDYVDDRSKLMPQEGHHAWFEYEDFLPHMAQYLPSPFNETQYSDLRELMTNEKELLYSYADVLTISMPKPRTKYYEAHIETVRGTVNTYFHAIEEALGFFPVELKSPLLQDLADYSRYVMFIAIIFDLVAILLVSISVLLIYSLLVINVETKTFDIGVQRMVGLTRRGLILLVLIQGVLFVVPALVSAFLVSIPALMAF